MAPQRAPAPCECRGGGRPADGAEATSDNASKSPRTRPAPIAAPGDCGAHTRPLDGGAGLDLGEDEEAPAVDSQTHATPAPPGPPRPGAVSNPSRPETTTTCGFDERAEAAVAPDDGAEASEQARRALDEARELRAENEELAAWRESVLRVREMLEATDLAAAGAEGKHGEGLATGGRDPYRPGSRLRGARSSARCIASCGEIFRRARRTGSVPHSQHPTDCVSLAFINCDSLFLERFILPSYSNTAPEDTRRVAEFQRARPVPLPAS